MEEFKFKVIGKYCLEENLYINIKGKDVKLVDFLGERVTPEELNISSYEAFEIRALLNEIGLLMRGYYSF